MKKFKAKFLTLSHKSAGSSSNKRYSTSMAGYSSMSAYEPALKVRPLPPLPGKEKV